MRRYEHAAPCRDSRREYLLYRKVRTILDRQVDAGVAYGAALSYHIWTTIHAEWGALRTILFLCSGLLRLLAFSPKLRWLRRTPSKSPRVILVHGEFLRSDLEETFRKIQALSDDADVLDLRGWEASASPAGLHYLLTQLLPTALTLPAELRLDQRLYLSCLLGQHVKFAATLPRAISFKRYRLALAFSDALPWPNVLMQVAKAQGCRTAALQHGQIIVYDESDPHINMINYESFVSDAFLIWGEFTRRELCKRIPAERLFIMGHPRYLDFDHAAVKAARAARPPSGVFGIAFEQEIYKGSNRRMLSIAEKVAEVLDLRYVVKMHPLNVRADYPEAEVLHRCVGMGSLDLAMDDFASRIDFCVARTSTVYNEMLVRAVPVFRYKDAGYYSMADHPDEFEDARGLLGLWNKARAAPQKEAAALSELAQFFFFGLGGESQKRYRTLLKTGEFPPAKT
ncbi:MAG: hypothetical protein WC969_02945 [Elusimicrobiota bacterium]|jgi:hypothetical protein